MPSESVRRLQRELNARMRPSPNLTPDGVLGPRTLAALRAYKSASAQVPLTNPPALITAGTTPLPAFLPAARAPEPVWMSVALDELGVTEIAGSEHNPRIVEYHAATRGRFTDDETPWCASFVNWVLREAGFRGTGSAAAISFAAASWGTSAAHAYGAIVTIRRRRAGADRSTGSGSGNHVGFFVSETGSAIRLLGGNQTGGTRVSEVNFSLSGYRVLACRWPPALA